VKQPNEYNYVFFTTRPTVGSLADMFDDGDDSTPSKKGKKGGNQRTLELVEDNEE
jgi:hypothetical protein